MRALVTGCAGFIGSHLAEALVGRGDEVVGVDVCTDYYDPSVKLARLDRLAELGVRVHRDDLRTADLGPLVDDVEVVFHQAGQPGVRLSWSDGFAAYDTINVLATQRLLEAVRATDVRRVVFASSSSVYGEAPRYPTTEDDLPAPRSPYGVTKLAAEHLCSLYAAQWGLPTVSLRYFTVYGPRQRPDMAFHRLCAAALGGAPFPLYGDGSQVRDFTFVADVVAANLAAADGDVPPGAVCNVAGGGSVSLAEVIDLVGDLAGAPVQVERHAAQPGDVSRTGGSTDRARALLGWEPTVSVAEGLAAQLAWHRAGGND